MPEDMGGLLPGVMWNPDGRDRKTHAVLFLCPKLQNYQIYAITRGKTYTNQNEIL
jgi:hypothetical protein